jgi:hypothetical protein
MSGSTADISHISEFGWYDWVMFQDNTPTFPDDKLVLGRYLGPATDVGSALTVKIVGRRTHDYIVFLAYAKYWYEIKKSPKHGELPSSHSFRIITN